MAKILCSIDTEKCTMDLTQDGEPIDHDHFVLGSYMDSNIDNGTPTSYYPYRYSYFSYSKKSEDGSQKDSLHASFKHGDPKSYSEKKTTHNLAQICANLSHKMIAIWDDIGDLFKK